MKYAFMSFSTPELGLADTLALAGRLGYDAIKGLKTSRIAAALGEKPYDEVVHRNNMTLA